MHGLARWVAGVLGILSCVGDVPAAGLGTAAPQAACQERACPRDAGPPGLETGACLSLSLEGQAGYALCWPGAARAAGAHAATNVLAALHDGPSPGPGSRCATPRRCLCVSISSHSLTLTVTLSARPLPGEHSTACVILGTTVAGRAADLSASRIVALHL